MASRPGFPFTCPGCKTTFAIPASLAGQPATCETCHTDFHIPALSGKDAPDPAAKIKSPLTSLAKNIMLLMMGAGIVWVTYPYLQTQAPQLSITPQDTSSSAEADPAPAPIIFTSVSKLRAIPARPPAPAPIVDPLPSAKNIEAPAAVTTPPAPVPVPVPTAKANEENVFMGPVPPTPQPVTANGSKPTSSETPAALDVALLRKDSRLTLEHFLKVSSVEERLAVSQNAEKMRPLMVEHYRTYPASPPPVEKITFLTEGEVADTKRVFHLYNVLLKDESAPIPVAVEETGDGYRVDWATYAESYTHRLQTFLSNPTDAPGIFRVVLKRAHYFGPPVSGQDTARIAYTVEAPMRDEAFHVWVDKDSSVYREKLSTGERAGWDTESYVIAELAWRGDDARGRWVSLRRIAGDSWRGE